MINKFAFFRLLTALIILGACTGSMAQQRGFMPEKQVAADFRTMLERPKVPFNAEIKEVRNDSLIIERGFIYSEADEKMPVLITKPVKAGPFPVVICLHGTGDSKDGNDVRRFTSRLVSAGFMVVAIDARFHGERVVQVPGKKPYDDAIINAWRSSASQQKHPFLYDTVYDLWRLTDYLVSRQDVIAERIGMTGISMGGIETWMAAAADPRIKVVVPVIAVQSFRWSLDNNRWQGRAGTIQTAHLAAAKDLGDTTLNKTNVEAFWKKVIPGITDEFDCPSMLRLIAPRPMLILNNERDANCPLPGAEIAFKSATDAYAKLNASDRLKINVSPNEPHRLIADHVNRAVDWFKQWL